MIEEIARDLRLAVQEDGLTAAPDSALVEAEIQVPAHQPYDMDIVERIVQRYEKILEVVGKAQQKNEKKDGL
jgi:segregation and condensation protein B